MNTATEEMTLIDAPVQQQAVPAVQQNGPLAMAMQAMKAGMSIADMRDMLELQKDWEANEARKAYVQAMSEFKQNPPEIFKRKEVAFSGTQYMHATLGDVTQAVMQALAQHGISHRWDTVQSNGKITVTCILTHKLGHSESTALEGSPDDSGKKNRIQQVASTVTYLQRYTLLAATGLATKDIEDDDGAGGDGYKEETRVDARQLDPSADICEVQKTNTDADAFAYWKSHQAKYQTDVKAHAEFKNAVVTHRNWLKTNGVTDVEAKQ